MADTPSGGHIGGFLSKETAGLPNWAWLLVLLVGGGIGFFIVRSQQNQASSSSSTTPGSETVPVTGGSPVYVVASSPATAPTTTSTAGTSTVGTTGSTGSAGSTGSLSGTPVLGSGLTTLLVKSTAASQKFGTVPLRASPGSADSQPDSQVVQVPIGTQLIASGPAVQGANNFGPGNAAGSSLWYPTSYNGISGYVSGYDVGTAGGSRFPPVYYHPAWQSAGDVLATMGG